VWTEAHTQLLLLAPDYFETHLRLTEVAMGSGVLSAKEKALVLVAVNGAVTHLQPAGLRASMQAALAAGASADEIIHVLRRISPLGIHSCMFGFPCCSRSSNGRAVIDDAMPGRSPTAA